MDSGYYILNMDIYITAERTHKKNTIIFVLMLVFNAAVVIIIEFIFVLE